MVGARWTQHVLGSSFERHAQELPADAQKTRIVFQARVRFAGAVTHRDWLEAGLWLRRRVEHPRLRRVESFGRLGYGHYFRLERVSDLDRAFAALVREAYQAARAKPGERVGA